MYFFLFVSLITGLPKAVAQQASAPLPVGLVSETKTFSAVDHPALSPDGKLIAFGVHDPSRYRKEPDAAFYRTGVIGGIADIYVVNSQNGNTTNLTKGIGANWAPSWSPDGKYLAFLSDRDGGQAKVWLWEVSSDTMRNVSDVLVRSANGIEWLPDGHKVLVSILPQGMTPEEYLRRTQPSQENDKSPESPKVSGATVTIYRSTMEVEGVNPAKTRFNLSAFLRDLVVVDVRDGSSKPIYSGHSIQWEILSPDGSNVVLVTDGRYEGEQAKQPLFDIKILNLKTGQEHLVLRGAAVGRSGTAISWSPDGSNISFRVDGGNEDGDYFVVDLNPGSIPKRLTQFPKPLTAERDLAPPSWDLQGKNIYFFLGEDVWQCPVEHDDPKKVSTFSGQEILALVQWDNHLVWSPDEGKSLVLFTRELDRKTNRFWKLDLSSGDKVELLLGNEIFPESGFVAGTRHEPKIIYFASDASHPTDLWVDDIRSHRSYQLTHLNPEYEKYELGTSREIDWLSLDGVRLHGALLLPPRYDVTRKYPLIVIVYGGAFLSNELNHFGGVPPINVQFLATRGYAVLMPDAPLHHGTPLADLGKTVLPGIDKAIEMGIADPGRLGVMGHSYGGYSTLSLLVQTKRFKSAVMSSGFGNMMGMYGEMTTDGHSHGAFVLENSVTSLSGSPWAFRDQYVENSPIFYIDRVETPLLILHGSHDKTVAPFLGDEIFVALRRLGKEVEFARYEGEDHSPATWSSSNYKDYCQRIIDWFDSHLGSPSR
jgi:dipeptidyl aminopeptidase/acylaminoacyl peptidase